MAYKINPFTGEFDNAGSAGGGGSTDTDFVTDSGTATSVGDSINLIGQDGITTEGAGDTVTITPRGSGTNNIFIGENAGSISVSGSSNSSFGANSLGNITSGLENTAFGASALSTLSTTSYNTAVGSGALNGTNGLYNTAVGRLALNANTSGEFSTAVGMNALWLNVGTRNTGVGGIVLGNMLTGSNNIGIGYASGDSYTSSESSNIVIGSVGVIADANTIRIGTQGTGAGQQDTTFIAGIVGVTNSNAQSVTINSSTGQLGVGAPAFAGWTEVTGTTQTAAVNSGYISSNASKVVITTPATAAVGDIISIVGKGAGGWTLRAAGVQLIRVGSSVSSAGGDIDSTDNNDTIEIICVTANSVWVTRSMMGNVTIT